MIKSLTNKRQKISEIFLKLSLLIVVLGAIKCTTVSKNTNSVLILPEGFESKVFIDSIIETTRHIAVAPNGTVYTKFKKTSKDGSLAALKDVNGDGVADSIVKFANDTTIKGYGYATASRIYKGYLYFSSELAVYRYKLDSLSMVPKGPLETVVIDDHPHGMHEHIGKPLAFDNEGYIYVPFGAPSNACQEPKGPLYSQD